MRHTIEFAPIVVITVRRRHMSQAPRWEADVSAVDAVTCRVPLRKSVANGDYLQQKKFARGCVLRKA